MAVLKQLIFRSATSTNSDITIPLVDPTKAFAIVTASINRANRNTDQWQHCVPIINSSTTVRLVTPTNRSGLFEIAVYEFDSGVTVQHFFDVSVPDGFTRDFTISSVDLAKSWVMGGIQWGGSNWGSKTDHWSFLNATTVRAVTLSDSSVSQLATFQVVEWDTATVQSADFTLDDVSGTDDFTITAVDASKSMIFTTQHVNSNPESIGQFTIEGTTTLRSIRNGIDSEDGHYFIVEVPEINIIRGRSQIDNGNTSDNLTLPSTISDISQAFPHIHNMGGMTVGSPDNGADFIADVSLALTIVDADTLDAERVGSLDNLNFSYQVIEFVGAPEVVVRPDLRGGLMGNLLGGFQ